MPKKYKKFRVERKRSNLISNNDKLSAACLTGAYHTLAKQFLSKFKTAFPCHYVVASDEAEAYCVLSERIGIKPERIRVLLNGRFRNIFSFENASVCSTNPDENHPVFAIAYIDPKERRFCTDKIRVNKTPQGPDLPVQFLDFTFTNMPCCNNTPQKIPMQNFRGDTASVICFCSIHNKTWREDAG